MPGFRDYSILKKLTRMNMMVSGIALALASVALITYDQISVRDAMMHQLSIQAQIIGSNSASALLFADPQSAEKTLSALRSAPNVTDAAITAVDGEMFATYSRDSREQRPSGAATIASSSGRF